MASEAEETSDWIAERNAATGQTSEFDMRDGAMPVPDGFVALPVTQELAVMMDAFYERWVAGAR